MNYKVLLLLVAILNTNLFSQSKFPTHYIPDRTYSGQSIFDIINVPVEKIDIGLWSIIISKEFDNSIDVNYYLNKLDEMVVEINRMLAGRTRDFDKFGLTRMFIYDSGIWNNNQPFQYDLDDPLGHNLSTQLLSTYIDTRKGNCVSMPTLFLALMERVDPNVIFRPSLAPLHLFCRFRDRQTGDVWNVEATNQGSPARNQWYIERMNISQLAIDKQSYLSDLTKKEFIAELINILASKSREDKQYKKALKYTELALKLSPNSLSALVQKGSLLAWIGYEKSQKEKLEKEEMKKLHDESEKYIKKAIELGWQERTKEAEEKYLKEVNEEKHKINSKSN
ncbi:MAG: hypothetical protein K8F60_01630 [Melioribacteraceae bacterium]|nr:hypothetical protein [Melioribacteraceae bacterium]